MVSQFALCLMHVMRAPAFKNQNTACLYTHLYTQKPTTQMHLAFRKNLHKLTPTQIHKHCDIKHTQRRTESLLSDWKPVNMFFHKSFYLLRSLFFCSILLDLNEESHLKTSGLISEWTQAQLKHSECATAILLFSSDSHWSGLFNATSDNMWQPNMS